LDFSRFTEQSASILSTGKKKQKASRVFGGGVFSEVESSLCYSPSPAPTKQLYPDANYSSPTPTVLFETEQNETATTKNASFVEDKENAAANTRLSTNTIDDKNSSIQSIRNAEMSRLRAAAQSPLRRDLVQKTQAAIKDATTTVTKSLKTKSVNSASVNHTLNASRKAKTQALRERATKTKTVRFQWDEEKAEAKSFYNKVEDSRRQILAIQRKLASAHFKEKAKKDDVEKMQNIAELDKNAQFNSEVFRDHQKKLKEERDKKRKKSMDVRAKLRQNTREGEEKLKELERAEEAAIFEVRYDLHRARNEVTKANEKDRRKSFLFRGGDAKRIKAIRLQWRQDEFNDQHKSFDLKTAAAKDVEQYKKSMDSERRDSLKSRNLEARKRREEQKRQDVAAMNAEHESYELKWAGESDAEAHRKQMAEERRKSLASRNKEGARHAVVMQELRSLEQEKEAESFVTKWAGEKDAKAYIAKMADDRRKSLQFRGQEAKKHRMYEDEEHQNAIEGASAEATLQSDCKFCFQLVLT
jgi:hypothetical protein